MKEKLIEKSTEKGEKCYFGPKIVGMCMMSNNIMVSSKFGSKL